MRKFIFTGLLLLAVVVGAQEIQFEKKTIRLGQQRLQVEIADTQEKTARELMFRRELPEGTGMLFIFEDEAPRSFWMKNTFIPLSLGFFDQKKKLVQIADLQPVKSEMDTQPDSVTSKHPAKYVLEVPQGWFKKHKIKIGTHFTGP